MSEDLKEELVKADAALKLAAEWNTILRGAANRYEAVERRKDRLAVLFAGLYRDGDMSTSQTVSKAVRVEAALARELDLLLAAEEAR